MPHWVALRFAYDGASFTSYQRQPEGGTVEDALVAALTEEGLVPGTYRTGSRTDRGVSALENVARAALERPHLRGLVPALNARLPDGLWVTGAAEVDPAWDPRRAAGRSYVYRAPDRGEDEDRVQAACAAFVGTHDMRAFARVEPHRDPVRRIDAFRAQREDGWRFTVEGGSFLWQQVRRMVGAVLAIGRLEAEVHDLEAALQEGRPHRTFRPMPAVGLCLAQVRYADLEWDPAAGRVQQAGVRTLLVAARVRLQVVEHLDGLSKA